MRSKLPKLQNQNVEALKLQFKNLSDGLKDVNKVLYYQDLSYVLVII